MQRLEVSDAVRPLQRSLGVKGLTFSTKDHTFVQFIHEKVLQKRHFMTVTINIWRRNFFYFSTPVYKM